MSASDELSETTKSWLQEMAVEEVMGIHNLIYTKPIIKGIVCEYDSIDLYNKVMFTHFSKNSVGIEKNGFKATPNLLDDDYAIKIVSSWDATTFPFFEEDVTKQIKKGGYDWQCRVYMMLFGISRSFVSYCLVDTPKGDLFLQGWENETLHRFNGNADAQKRVSISKVIERDTSIEQEMRERYEIANRYYQNYLEELYYK